MHHSNSRLWLRNLMKWSKIICTQISEIAKFEITKNFKNFQNIINIDHKNWNQCLINQNSIELKKSKTDFADYEIKLKTFYSIENFLKFFFKQIYELIEIIKSESESESEFMKFIIEKNQFLNWNQFEKQSTQLITIFFFFFIDSGL